MIYIVNQENCDTHQKLIDSAMRLRYRVFKQRMDWEVMTQGNQEQDAFDNLPDILYVLHVDANGEVDGCARLIPTTGPYMLRDIFPILLDGKPAPSSPRIWEGSRFAVDPNSSHAPGVITARLLDAECEVGINYGLTHIVTVTNLLMERILKRNGLPTERIGQAHRIGNTEAIATNVPTSLNTLEQLRDHSGITSSQIYVAPWIREAA